MSARQRIPRIRREYNQWVANQTLEDYALRFTAKAARRWSAAAVANTALGAISFLMLEAIGGTVTLAYGFSNAVPAILLAGVLIFATGIPISVYAARYGVDVDLLTRGAGFGYFGSTVTSLVYASFTFIFFALEAVILAAALRDCLGIPEWLGYILCALVVIPLVTHGITFIGRIQAATQPFWLVLNLVPICLVLAFSPGSLAQWRHFAGDGHGGFTPLAFAAAASVVFSLVAQIGEQVDFLRFLPERRTQRAAVWWTALLAGGPGWIVPGTLKMLAGSFLAVVAIQAGESAAQALQPQTMYRVAFSFGVGWRQGAVLLAGCLVMVSQLKINVTNAYAGSIAWSNFFSRLTHSHPGRVVWVVFNIAIALLLMELGVYHVIEHTLLVYSSVAAAWMGALVSDLVVNKPLGLSPPGIEFKRAHLYDINPVGVGAMVLGASLSLAACTGALGPAAAATAPFLAFAAAFLAAPLIAWRTGGRFYLARRPRAAWQRLRSLTCVVCENPFDPDDMAHCPAYAGAICSLCCSLDARCQDMCRPHAHVARQFSAVLPVLLPKRLRQAAGGTLGRFLGVMALFTLVLAAVLAAIYVQAQPPLDGVRGAMQAGGASLGASVLGSDKRVLLAMALAKAFCVLLPATGVVAWLLVLAQDSRRTAQTESRTQTGLLLSEIRAHEKTDAKLQRAKEAAEAANLAKSRYVVGISHELRTPLNAILGYAQLLEREAGLPERRRHGLRVIRRSGEHLAGLIEGLLDISKIEAGRIDIARDEVRLPEFLDQIVNMFGLQAELKGVSFGFERPPHLPERVVTDERRLRQILINLLSNALKFTARGEVRLTLAMRSEIAEFIVSDTGPGVAAADQERIFEPFQRIQVPGASVEGVGLGLTITRLLVQIMGGEITLDSAPGQGCRFRVRLLLSSLSPQRHAGMIEADAPRSLAGYDGPTRRIMVADDDEAHRCLMQDLLTPLGFEVALAASGEDCLALARRGLPDLFLLDLAMPDMSGWELARRLRSDLAARAPILLVSANAAELAGRPPESFHDDVFAKPVALDALLERIGLLLGLHWHHAAITGPRSGKHADQATRPAPAASGLDADQLDGLRQIAAIGFVRGIHARLDLLEAQAPGSAAFVSHLRGLVSEFRLDEFGASLDEAVGVCRADNP